MSLSEKRTNALVLMPLILGCNWPEFSPKIMVYMGVRGSRRWFSSGAGIFSVVRQAWPVNQSSKQAIVGIPSDGSRGRIPPGTGSRSSVNREYARPGLWSAVLGLGLEEDIRLSYDLNPLSPGDGIV